MKQKISYLIGLLIAFIIIFAVPANASTATVTANTVNLRKDASTTAEVIETLTQNTSLEIISQEGDWYKVKHGDNVGYVRNDLLKLNSETTSTQGEETQQSTEKSTTQVETTAENSKINLIADAKVRILPVINSNIIGDIKNGTTVEILAKTNKWAFVQNDEITGWIYLTTIDNKTETQQEQTNTNPQTTDKTSTETATSIETEKTNTTETTNSQNTSSTNYDKAVTKYVNTSSIYVREKASSDSSIVTSLIKNTDVKVTGEENGWYKITYGDKTGYIRKDLLSDTKAETTSRSSETSRLETASNIEASQNSDASSLGEEIVAYAKQYLGCPYVYGAAGSSSFDCSGFTMYVYKHFGYSLTHSASAQATRGVEVSKDNLQPGDLVFFLDYPSMEGIGHVGIYIGGGNFIHASSGTGYCVKTSTLLSGSYLNRYVTARRLI